VYGRNENISEWENGLMIYKEVLESRLARKKQELNGLEKAIEGAAMNAEKRKFIELKAIVNELENCIDIAAFIVQLQGSG
jgi:hypothetical protein